MVAPRFSSKPKSLWQQKARLDALFPQCTCWIKCNRLTWEGKFSPTTQSDTYHLRMTYTLEKAPEMRLVAPEIRRINGRRPEHMYNDTRLCLYMTGSGEWHDSKFLAETIVPWAAEWLWHYEVWLASDGTWCGGGVHPRSGKPYRSLAAELRTGIPDRRQQGLPAV